jgi:hypothetical protein
MLLKNQYTTKNNFNTEDTLHRINGYRIVNDADLVFYKNHFLDLNKLKKFTFGYLDEINYRDRNTYLLSFKEKKIKGGSTGIIYIDVNSYAIVKIDIQEFDVNKFSSSKIDLESKQIEYKLINDKWFIDEIKISLNGNHDAINFSSLKQFKALELNAISNFKIPYAEVIQDLSETIKINKNISDVEKEDFNKTVASLEEKEIITILTVPDFSQDSIRPNKGSLAHKIINIFLSRYRFNAQLNKLPYNISDFQPLLSTNISLINNYALSLGTQIKLYKSVFFAWDDFRNYALGGINNKISTYSLNYNFEFNKKGHPMSITPSFGYSVINISKKKENFYNQKNISLGLNLSYERSHVLNYIIGIKYLEPLSTTNKGLIIKNYKFYPSIGIQLKLN